MLPSLAPAPRGMPPGSANSSAQTTPSSPLPLPTALLFGTNGIGPGCSGPLTESPRGARAEAWQGQQGARPPNLLWGAA